MLIHAYTYEYTRIYIYRYMLYIINKYYTSLPSLPSAIPCPPHTRPGGRSHGWPQAHGGGSDPVRSGSFSLQAICNSGVWFLVSYVYIYV